MSGDDKIWQVAEVNAIVRELLENSLMPFWMRGEIGTLSVQRASGHVYMTLKDRRSQLRVVFFSGARAVEELGLRIGSEGEGFGRLTVYEVRGEYQFSVKSIRPVGFGELQRRFEELKQKLNAEGLFDQERKKNIPLLPGCIGVVTSPDGAAIRDFLQITARRFPGLPVRIYPSPVQGAAAAAQLARGIEFFNRTGEVEVIVLTRGGGSMEDLWAFNEEVLVRAVAASRIPVISAVGHEIDFTLCDFAADLRVPTPSAAAELTAAHRDELSERLIRLKKDMVSSLDALRNELRHRLGEAAGSFVFREPVYMIRQKQQLIDEIDGEMKHALQRSLANASNRAGLLAERLKGLSPQSALREKRLVLEHLGEQFVQLANSRCGELANRLEQSVRSLNNLDPGQVLKRGYAMVSRTADGKLITAAADAPVGDELNIRLADGAITVRREH